MNQSNNLNNEGWKVTAAEADSRLDKWLAAPGRLGSRSKSLAAIERGKVFVNEVEQTVTDAGRRLQPGDAVRLWMDRPGSATRRYSERHDSGLHLMYEDSLLLVVNKPAGLLSVPLPAKPDEESLFDQVKFHLRSHDNRDPLVVHRIDRDTSGLILFAKTGDAQHKLKEQFERREPERVYLAAVHGHPNPESGTWKDLLEWDQDDLKQQSAEEKTRFTKQATSRYRVVEKFASASLVEIRLVTGKRNQIRIQAGLRGHPIIGERMYVYDPAPEPKIEFERQALHAFQLGFKHPADQRPLKFEASPPADFAALLERLRKARA